MASEENPTGKSDDAEDSGTMEEPEPHSAQGSRDDQDPVRKRREAAIRNRMNLDRWPFP